MNHIRISYTITYPILYHNSTCLVRVARMSNPSYLIGAMCTCGRELVRRITRVCKGACKAVRQPEVREEIEQEQGVAWRDSA